MREDVTTTDYKIMQLVSEISRRELTGRRSERWWAPTEQLSATRHSVNYERFCCVERSATANCEVETRRLRLS